MKTNLLFLTLAAACVVAVSPMYAVGPDLPGDPVPLTPPPDSSSAPAAASTAAAIPSVNYTVSRYEALWTKSPFAVATSEETVQASPDYMLVGIANVDGIFYASLIERDNQEHFLISSDNLTRGMTLKSISKSSDGQDTYATVMKEGVPIMLKLEQPPPSVGPVPQQMAIGAAAPNAPPPGIVPQQIQMPGVSAFPNNGGSVRPFTRMHRPQINLPPRMQQQASPPPAPPPQPGTTQMAPPPPH